MNKRSLIVFLLCTCLASINLAWQSEAAEVVPSISTSAQTRIDLKSKIDQQISALKIATEESIPAYEDFLQVKADPPGDTLAEQKIYLDSTRTRLQQKVSTLTKISAQISALMNQLCFLQLRQDLNGESRYQGLIHLLQWLKSHNHMPS